MQTALRRQTRVQPGGRVEITDWELPAGAPVDVIILLGDEPTRERCSLMDVLSNAPGNLAFHTAQEVDSYLAEERAGWER